ncbi:MAG: fumarylacetoacetate hydrolase family protein [Muribaculaceae bacterium]|nr:fumarylacetoacetate hydrolase family protein [Muribaculaceae bacterium]
MKIFSILNNYRTISDEHDSNNEPFWTILPDSAMLRSGKPIFLPQEEKRYTLCPCMCLRIGRLGKRVAGRFAYRYVNALAPAVAILPDEIIPVIQRGIVPSGAEWIFDGAVMIGDFTDLPAEKEEIEKRLEEAKIVLTHNDERAEWKGTQMRLEMPDILTTISYYNTIKSGDMILTGINIRGIQAHIDTSAEAYLNGVPQLKFNVK